MIYPHELPPSPGEAIDVAPGIKWIRMPLPFALNHINLWLLEDGEGWCLVDTGLGVEKTWSLWEQHFATTMGGRPVTRIIVTHYHPDHMGSAAWLAARTGAPVHVTEAEFLMAHAVHAGIGPFVSGTSQQLFAAHGLDAARLAQQAERGNNYARGVPELPLVTTRLMDGDTLDIGGHNWRVTTVFGHAPEHATLYCQDLGVLISGDQVLPRITTNVSVWGNHPDGDPLKLFLDSLGRFAHLPDETLVLPSHDRVFTGLNERIAQLHAHHAARFAEVEAACLEPKSAAEIIPVLFKRELDGHQLMFAMGEAIAHLNHLWHAHRLARQLDDGGTYRFQSAGSGRGR